MRLTFYGKPLAKQRHRMSNGRMYNPQKKIEGKIKYLAWVQAMGEEPLTGPIAVHITAHFKRPKSHYGTQKGVPYLKDTAPKHHTGKPDVDNIGKFYLDVLNGIVFVDDRQVCRMIVVKNWSETEGVFIDIGRPL